MNLTIDPWIPALRNDGLRELFSLQDLFAQAHELRDLAVKPHERIALMRLLLCITQIALDGPADEDEWENCQSFIQPRVRDYLKKWQAAFELFGDGQRFLQVRNLKAGRSGKGNAATKLDLTLATGNTAILFDNFAGEERQIKNARGAMNLLTFQCFTPSEIVGAGVWSNTEIPQTHRTPSPLCCIINGSHLVLGGNLLKRLPKSSHQGIRDGSLRQKAGDARSGKNRLHRFPTKRHATTQPKPTLVGWSRFLDSSVWNLTAELFYSWMVLRTTHCLMTRRSRG